MNPTPAPSSAAPTGASGKQDKPFPPWLFWSGIAAVCAVIAAASFTSQLVLQKQYPVLADLPKLHRVPPGLVALERSGKPVDMGEIDGKVRVFAYLYTVCPHGCAAIIGEMLKLDKQFGRRTDFHQVSISVLPERDTVAMMAAYADGIGVTPDAPWWFLTGDRRNLWYFMTEGLKLEPAMPIPEEERLNPLDLYAHDLRIVLVDREGFVRSYYSVFHPQPEIATLMGERLHRDVQLLLDNPDL